MEVKRMADFSEKITGNIDKNIRTVSSKGKELLETAKLKGEVTDTEVSIQRKFNALGKKVFEMLNRGALNEEVLMKDSGEISNLFSRITELEEAVKKVELEALKIQSEVDTIISSKGSSPDKSDADFYINDGTLLKKEIDTTKIDDQKFKPAAQPAVKKVALPKDEFRRRTPKTWIGILTVICLAAGTGSYVYFSSQAGEESAEITIRPEHMLEKPVSPPVYKPEPPKSFAAISEDPDKIEGEINRAFREAGLNGITAKVSDSLEVTLKGSVRSNYKKDRAFEIAKTFTDKGIKRIRDMIFVVEQ
jgi:hypothetical protein